jgi:heterodisulfide reductase subunit C
LVRTEWIEPMYGPRLVRAFEEIKDAFDPRGLFNPGKIVYSAAKMDDRTLFRYKPDYRVERVATALDWSDWGGFDKAVEMCNNNGLCRKFDAGTMCPSYRATGDERHLTRGRANTLRLALSGQLGPGALTSDELYETMDLCVSCKGCRRECPTGVDMAKMKIEFLHHYRRRHGLRLRIGWSRTCRVTQAERPRCAGSSTCAMRFPAPPGYPKSCSVSAHAVACRAGARRF